MLTKLKILLTVRTFVRQLPSRLDDKKFLLRFSKFISARKVDRIVKLSSRSFKLRQTFSTRIRSEYLAMIEFQQILDLLNNEIIRHKKLSWIFHLEIRISSSMLIWIKSNRHS